MTKASILDALVHQPLTPKLVHLSDGTTLEVNHPDEFVFAGQHGPNVGVLFRPDGGFRVIDLEHVVSVDVPAKP